MPTSTIYPNGQVLISSALTVSQINVLLQNLTCGMLGINPPDPMQVRIDWPTEGQPFINRPADDVCFLSCVLQDVDYSKIRDRAFTSNGATVTETWSYTRGWKVAWTLYGPNSTDRARQIHSAVVFMDYFNDQLSLSNLYPVSDPPEPTRTPEQSNAQWFERADFHCIMYEAVTETIEDGKVTSVEVKVYDGSPHDPVADFTVSS